MPIARIQMPDGRIARVEVPEGTTPEEAMAFVNQQVSTAPTDQSVATLSDDPAAAVVPTEEPPGMIANAGRAAVKGATQALGFPGEVALAIPKAGAMLAGDDESLEVLRSVDPTGAFQDVFGYLGMRSDPDLEDRPFRERFLANTAEAVTGGAVGLGAGGQARGVLAPAAERLAGGRLGRLFGEDAAAGTAGAFARTSLEELGAGSELEALGEFATSVLTGSAVGKARVAKEIYTDLRDSPGKINQGQITRASKFMQDTLGDFGEVPSDVARLLREAGTEGSEGMILPGARVESVGLTMIENALIQADPKVQAKFQRSQLDLKEFVHQELKEAIGDGVSDDFIDWYRTTSDYAVEITEKAYQQAIERAAREASELPPIGIDHSSRVKEVLKAHKEADRGIERELYAEVINNRVDASPMSLAYDDLLEEVKAAGRGNDPGDMPNAGLMARYRNIAGRSGDAPQDAISAHYAPKIPEEGPPAATVSELLALRSNLLDEAADAAANNQSNLARRLNNLADGALNALDNAGEEVATARAFSRALNDRYSRDVIQPLLGKSASRGEKVAANEVMDRIFKKGEAGRTGVRALKLAVGEMPQDAKNYILQRFNESVIDGGRIKTNQAAKFISQHRPALEEAGLLETTEAYLALGRSADDAEQTMNLLTRSVGQNATMRVLKSYGSKPDDVTNAIANAFKARQGGAQNLLSQMYAEAETDLSGNALAGLKSMTVDGVMKSAFKAAGDGSSLLPEISARVRNALSITGHFSDVEIKRVERVLNSLYKETMAASARALKGRSNTIEDVNKLGFLGPLFKLAFLKKIAPALTKGAGGGALATASMVGRAGAAVGESIASVFGIEDAAAVVKRAIFEKDEKLLDALLTMDTNPASQGIVMNAIEKIKRFAVEGALRPSQVTIANDEIIEEENREK